MQSLAQTPITTLKGVGAKVALAVLSTLSPADLANAIALQDKAMVARAVCGHTQWFTCGE
mgnify:CR=1 FL=1